MKLFKENKYANKMTRNLSAILASSIILSGCASNANMINITPPEASSTSTPVVESTPIVEPTPVVTLEPTIEPMVTPEPTPFIRTSYEIPSEEEVEERLQKYYILEDNKKYFAYDILCIDITTKDDEKKSINGTIDNFYVGEGPYIVKDIAGDTELFSFSENDPGFYPKGDYRRNENGYYGEDIKITPLNPYFEGTKINYISSIWCDWFYKYTKQYITDEDLYVFVDFLTEGNPDKLYGAGEHSYTREEVVRAICTWLPEEYAITSYDLHPELFIENDEPVK